jgi:hypothetical protein
MLEGELDEVLERARYHGHRSRTLLGTFGQVKIEVPRARLDTPDGSSRLCPNSYYYVRIKFPEYTRGTG